MLIFLEGMFREPPSPRGKDNGGCDVTSILGSKVGGVGGGGRKKSWVALMSSGMPYLEHPTDGGLKMAARVYIPRIYTPTPVLISSTHSFVLRHS